MKKKLLFLLIPFSCMVGFLMWWFSTDQVLLRRSASLIDCVRMEKDTGRIQRAYKAENLRDLIAQSITVTYPQMESTFSHHLSSNAPITLSEDRAKTALLYLTELAEWISVENETLEVVDHKDDSAKVALTFKLTAKLNGKPEQSSEMHGTFSFQKVNNRWLLSKATFQ